MSLWWLQPGWKGAVCGCGANIWQSGGDPDWGVCYDCMNRLADQRESDRGPLCDICQESPAVAGSNGYGVCSEACDAEAKGREPLVPA